jgi:hypothetical protein
MTTRFVFRPLCLTGLAALALWASACGAPNRTATVVARTATTATLTINVTIEAITDAATVAAIPPTTEASPVATTAETVAPTAIATTITTIATEIPPAPTPLPNAVAASNDGVLKALVWQPASRTLALWPANGTASTVMTAEGQDNLAMHCATSASRRWQLLHIGSETLGNQYLYDTANGTVQLLGRGHSVNCSLAMAHFSPDDGWLLTMRYSADAPQNNYLAGALRAISLADASAWQDLGELDDAVDFALGRDAQGQPMALVMQFFANSQDEANAADVQVLSFAGGSLTTRYLNRGLAPSEGCVFVSGRLLQVEQMAVLLLGERCRGSRRGNFWQLYTLPIAAEPSQAPQKLAEGKAGGNYFTTTKTGDLRAVPGNAAVLVSYPNGLGLEIADMARVSLSDGSIQPVLASYLAESHPQTSARPLQTDSSGRWLAFITRDGDGGEALYVYDSATADAKVALVAGGKRGDRIYGFAWAAETLYYLSGGESEALNSISLSGQNEKRLIVRGTFSALAVSGSDAIALRQESDGGYNFVRIALANGEITVLEAGPKGQKPPQLLSPQ